MLENVFEFPYKVLTFMGFWGVESKSKGIKTFYLIYQILMCTYMTIFLGFAFCDLFIVWNDVHKASTNISATMTIVMFLWKNIQALKKMSQTRQLQRNLKNGFYTFPDEEDRKILHRAAVEMKLSVMAVYTLAVTTLTAWLISGVFLKPRDDDDNLPIPIWIPWKHRKSPYYELGLLFQAFGGYIVAVGTVTLNIFMLGSVVQICAEYDILLKNTEKMNEWCVRLFKGERMQNCGALTKEENSMFEEMIVRNIQHHQKILKSTEEAENCHVYMMLVQFGGAATLITVIALDLILVSTELNSRVYPLIVFLILVVMDTYLFCSYGARLLNKSHEFLDRIYEIPWEIMNDRNKKLVLFIVTKGQHPPKLTVGKFANIDLYTLLKMSKIVYNVLYLLLHLAKKGKKSN